MSEAPCPEVPEPELPLAERLAMLPDVLDYSGEFGAELVLFIPFVHWLHRSGHLGARRVSTYAGMRPYYYFLAPEQLEEKPGARHYVPPSRRPAWLPHRNEHRTWPSELELWPDYRARYRGQGPVFDRPVMVVNNKYGDEWNSGPVNFMSCELLEQLFSRYAQRYQIVYFRQGLRTPASDFVPDNSRVLQLDDAAVLARHPQVQVFDDLLAAHPGESYNSLKLKLFADTWMFVSSQGGGAHLCSLFSGSLLLVLHRRGQESSWAYLKGYYRYAATPPPSLLVARDTEAFAAALEVFEHATVGARGLRLDARGKALLGFHAPGARRPQNQPAAAPPPAVNTQGESEWRVVQRIRRWLGR